MAENGISTINLPLDDSNPAVEVLVHAQVGGQKIIRRQSLGIFIARILALAGGDAPSATVILAVLTARGFTIGPDGNLHLTQPELDALLNVIGIDPSIGGIFDIKDRAGNPLARFSSYGLEIGGSLKIGYQGQVSPTGAGGFTIADQNGFAAFHVGPRGAEARAFGVPGQFRLAAAPPALAPGAVHLVDPLGFIGGALLTDRGAGSSTDFTRTEVDSANARSLSLSSLLRNRTNTLTAVPRWGYNHVFVYGQSLGQGYEGWPVKTKVGRSSVAMIGASVRPRLQAGSDGTPVAPITLQPAVSTVQNVDTGAILTESQQAALGQGDPSVGEEVGVNSMHYARSLMLQAMMVRSDEDRRILISNASVGGKTVEELSKGAPVEIFNRLRDLARAGKAAVMANSVSYGVLAMFWLQGENSQNPGTPGDTSYAGYRAKLSKLYDDFVADVCVDIAGQNDLPAMILYQTSGAYQNDAFDMAVPMAQLDLCRDGGRQGWFMATPAYPFTDKVNTHLTANGYRWMGLQFGKVFHEVVALRRTWRPVHVTGATLRGRTILATIHTPCPPLQFQPMYVGDTPVMLQNKGFTVVDAAGVVPIASVELPGDAVVLLKLQRSIVGSASLYYGRKTESDGGGNLCDSDPTIAPLNYEYAAGSGDYPSANIPALVGKPYPLWNWCALSKTPLTRA